MSTKKQKRDTFLFSVNKEKHMKQVQISEDLFLSLIKYHILEYHNDEEKIVKMLK